VTEFLSHKTMMERQSYICRVAVTFYSILARMSNGVHAVRTDGHISQSINCFGYIKRSDVDDVHNQPIDRQVKGRTDRATY
jgi:hypothetical protein